MTNNEIELVAEIEILSTQVLELRKENEELRKTVEELHRTIKIISGVR